MQNPSTIYISLSRGVESLTIDGHLDLLRQFLTIFQEQERGEPTLKPDIECISDPVKVEIKQRGGVQNVAQ
jgi:hypothetical protein